jgi:hypothetical protein
MPKKTRSLSDKFGLTLILFLFISLGAAIRLFFVLRSDFPINDGGMLYQMTQELRQNHFILPAFTGYNLARIPYAYPPLPFYLAGSLEALLGCDLYVLVRLLPVIFNILAIPAFFDLSRQILKNDYQALHASLAFTIIPPSYEWLIMGGGLTRSPAVLFSILALGQFVRALKTESRRTIILAILFTCLTGYCHMEVLWVTVVFMGLVVLISARQRKGWLVLIATGCGAAMLMAPYVLYVINLHGVSPFISAMQSGQFNWAASIGKLLLVDITGEYFFTPILVFAMLGFGRALLTRDCLLPAWTLAAVLSDPRSVERSLVIPVCMLAAIGLDKVIIPGMAYTANAIGDLSDNQKSALKQNIFPNLICALLITYMFIRSAVTGPFYILREGATLQTLSQADRQAMQWVADNTPHESSFLVLTPPSIWEKNEWTEWFPVLAQRRSVTTVQGSEWLPDGQFTFQEMLYDAVLECIPQEIMCIERATQNMGVRFTHVYINGQVMDTNLQIPYTLPIATALHDSIDYELIYEQNGITIYKKDH